MRISLSTGLPLLIIIVGVGYLLANLGITPNTPWQAFVQYWPALLILWGLRVIIRDIVFSRFRTYKTTSLVYGSALIFIGLHLLVPRLGFAGFSITWNIVWPVLLIVLGLQILLNRRRKLSSSSYICSSFTRGGSAWYVDDLYLNQFIGDIDLDLTKAVIPNKEIFFDINGSVGDVAIYLPSYLPVHAKCRVGIGDVEVLERSEEGMGASIDLKTADYDQAERKLNLTVSIRIGSVTVRRI